MPYHDTLLDELGRRLEDARRELRGLVEGRAPGQILFRHNMMIATIKDDIARRRRELQVLFPDNRRKGP